MRFGNVPAHWLLCTVLAVGACSEPNQSSARDQTLSSRAAAGRRALSPQMQAHTGLSHLPEPVDDAELAARLKQHYPAQFRGKGVSGSALLDVQVGAEGQVLDVGIVSRRQASPGAAEAILQHRGETTVLELSDRPEFGAAAQAALRETRFHPALKDGDAVPYKLRLTVHFDPAS